MNLAGDAAAPVPSVASPTVSGNATVATVTMPAVPTLEGMCYKKNRKTTTTIKPTTTVAKPKPTQAPQTQQQQPKPQAQAPPASSGNSCVDRHNHYRAQKNVGGLKWDSNLAASAQNWANTLASTGALQHSGGNYGENIHEGGTDCSGAVDSWMGEQGAWYANPLRVVDLSNYVNYGHYTQVMWSGTSKVGCGSASGYGSFVVCQYLSPEDVSYAVESIADEYSQANNSDSRWEKGQSFLSQDEVVIIEDEYSRDPMDQFQNHPESHLEQGVVQNHQEQECYEEYSQTSQQIHSDQDLEYSHPSDQLENNSYSQDSDLHSNSDKIEEIPRLRQAGTGFVETPTAHSTKVSYVEPAQLGEMVSLPRRKEARWSSQFDDEVPVEGLADEVRVQSPRSFAVENIKASKPAKKDAPSQKLSVSPPLENRDTSMESAQPLTKPDYPDLDTEKKKRFMYCCIPVNKKSRYICLGVTLLFIAAAAIVGYFFYPSEINNAGVLPTQEVFGKVNRTRIKVDSSNRQQEIGHGVYSQEVVFEPGTNFTFQIPLRVEYAPNPQYGALNDPALNEILQLCQTERISTRHTTIHYEAYNEITLLKMFGVTPNLRGELNINCPFQGADYNAFLVAIGKELPPIDAILYNGAGEIQQSTRMARRRNSQEYRTMDSLYSPVNYDTLDAPQQYYQDSYQDREYERTPYHQNRPVQRPQPQKVGNTFITSAEAQEYITLPKVKAKQENPRSDPVSSPLPMNGQYNEGFVAPPVAAEAWTISRTKSREELAPETNYNNVPEDRKSFESMHSQKAMTNDRKKPTKRYMYGCIPTNPKSRKICLGITAMLLVVLGVVLFLFFPRFPDMHVNNIQLVPGNSFKLSPVTNVNGQINFSFQLDMIMNISVSNSNMYHLKVDAIDLNAFIMANATEINSQNPSPAESLLGATAPTRIFVNNANMQQKIGNGTFGSIIFPPGKTTTFMMNFTVFYSPNQALGATNDPALNEIIQLCVSDPNVPAGQNRTTIIKYQASTPISIFTAVGYTPNIQNQLNINCPFQGQEKTKLIQTIAGGGTKGATGST
ncbi:hypothetical protein HDV01_007449 [Terramyces sp. JEL0728]|nr:hypothetical protein HDV01_007449 [Terramyces sp. JEL0728]